MALTNSTDSTDSKVLTDVSNLSVKISGRSDIGGQKYNQDAYWISNNLSYGINVIGVLDGHDKDTGKIVADTAKNFAESFTLTNIELAKSNPIEFLELIFEGTQCIIKDTLCNFWRERFFEIKEESGFILKKRSGYTSWEIIRGGATKSMCMIVGNKMYIANVGDSSGILYSSLPVLKKSFIKYEKDVETGITKPYESDKPDDTDISSDFLILTADHSPENSSEYDRIRKQYLSETVSSRQNPIFVYDDVSICNKSLCSPIFNIREDGTLIKNTIGIKYHKNVRQEPASYITTPNDSTYPDSLAFTRSIGDLYLGTFGLSHKPEISSVNFDTLFDAIGTDLSKTICIILATDGVWDNWTYHDVGLFLMHHTCIKTIEDSPDSGTHEVTNAFMDRNDLYAKRNFGRSADNATAIVMYISKN